MPYQNIKTAIAQRTFLIPQQRRSLNQFTPTFNLIRIRFGVLKAIARQNNSTSRENYFACHVNYAIARENYLACRVNYAIAREINSTFQENYLACRVNYAIAQQNNSTSQENYLTCRVNYAIARQINATFRDQISGIGYTVFKLRILTS
jgi:hypothetical protein